MNLFSRIKAKKSEAVKTSRQKYLELLIKINPDSPTDAQQNQLEKLMAELNLSVAEVEADHRLIIEAVSKKSLAANRKEKDQRHIELDNQLQEAYAARQKQYVETNKRLADLMGAKNAAKADAQYAYDAYRYLEKLKETQPEIYAAIQKPL